MAVVLKEQLELRPSVALQKKVGLKSLEQVIRWGDRVNQELRRWRKLEDKKCWRARARCIRKKSRGGSSRLSKAQALVELEQSVVEKSLRIRVADCYSGASCSQSKRRASDHRPPPSAPLPSPQRQRQLRRHGRPRAHRILKW